jgi:serine/threonine-protein kinase
VPIDHLTIGRTALSIIAGDITRVGTVAIVNAANTELMGGGGVDGAIHRAAGPELYALTRRLGGCPVGGAVITDACRIPPPTSFIIHAVGPVYEPEHEAECAELLASAYRESLALVEENRIPSVAFPAISTGIYGYPLNKAARIAFAEVTAHLEARRDTHLQWVVFSVFSERDRDAYRALFARR